MRWRYWTDRPRMTTSPGNGTQRKVKMGNYRKTEEAIAKLSPEQLARFRRWFSTFEAGSHRPRQRAWSPDAQLMKKLSFHFIS